MYKPKAFFIIWLYDSTQIDLIWIYTLVTFSLYSIKADVKHVAIGNITPKLLPQSDSCLFSVTPAQNFSFKL